MVRKRREKSQSAHSGQMPKSPEKPQKLMERFFGLVALKVLWGLQISRFGALLGF